MASWRWHLGAGLLYGAASWLILDHGASLARNYLGAGEDPAAVMWSLAWWPWAVAHHVHGWQTHLVGEPVGTNLAWTTCVPLLALLALPVTLLGGPLLAFNLLNLAALPLAALAAYALCLELFEAPAAASAGGWLFGFSSYEAVQSIDHLNLDFTCLLPLIPLVLVRRARNKMGRSTCVALLALLMAGEFYISLEVAATFALFAGLAFALAFARLPEWRGVLKTLAVDGVLAAPVMLALAAPQLAGLVFGPDDARHPAGLAVDYSIDLLNFFIPTQASLLGGPCFAGLTRLFTGGLDENGGYLGLPMIALLALVARDFAARAEYRYGFLLLGLSLLAALGPVLHVAGHVTAIALPWLLVMELPLLGAALPARCMMFAALLIAVLVAGWIAGRPGPGRALAVFAVCLSLLPAWHAATPAPALAFFQPGRVEAALGPARRLLILPFGISGPGTYWQAEEGFGFTQVGGYLGYPSREALADPVVMELSTNHFDPDFAAGFAAFCVRTGAEYVVATPRTRAAAWDALRELGWPHRRVDDVEIFAVPVAAHG
jgi:hypothetical protein